MAWVATGAAVVGGVSKFLGGRKAARAAARRKRKLKKGGQINTRGTKKMQAGGSVGNVSKGRNLSKICKNRPKGKKLLDQYGNDMCLGHR